MGENGGQADCGGTGLCTKGLGPTQILFFIFLAMPHGLWDLSSPTRDRTQAPAVKVLSPNHWTAREFPPLKFYIFWIRGSLYHEK